jgi:hypothetical protein
VSEITGATMPSKPGHDLAAESRHLFTMSRSVLLPSEKVDYMPATNANVRSASAGAPSRACDNCDADMTHLSDLQPMIGSAAMRIFRCYSCNHVVSEER